MLTEVYCAQKTIDDRGALGAVIGYFSTEPAATLAAAKQGWYGGDGRVTRCWIIAHEGRFYPIERGMEKGMPLALLDQNIPEETKRLRAAAWIKVTEALSPDERDLLGLQEPKS
ncbi:hypothetical protein PAPPERLAPAPP_05020 [Brevundimonas phage vB_BpoS-Papperlapapp]|nr:hypothetical protein PAPPERLAPAPP_05020 [Brevundimonas phage vB_BpoS-Papperlapapp]